ncbi:hypothetical protein JL39_23285 [Rhizobium sp. YS-1r]|nr:hypothetical protein JL39_23285 [Rhizobium sp. YS-1r]
MTEQKTLATKPHPAIAFLAALFFVACALFVSWIAVTNEKALVLNGLLHLSPDEATGLYWGLAAASIGLAISGFRRFYRLLTGR